MRACCSCGFGLWIEQRRRRDSVRHVADRAHFNYDFDNFCAGHYDNRPSPTPLRRNVGETLEDDRT